MEKVYCKSEDGVVLYEGEDYFAVAKEYIFESTVEYEIEFNKFDIVKRSDVFKKGTYMENFSHNLDNWHIFKLRKNAISFIDMRSK